MGAARPPRTTTPTVELAGQGLRYLVAGAIVGLVYVGLTLLLSGPVGVPIQLAIPVSYATAIVLHFLLQRVFVFAHVATFALSARAQAGRYVAIALVQYPLTALATAVLPGVLGLSQQLVYLATTAVITLATFIVLRTRVFHSHEPRAADASP